VTENPGDFQGLQIQGRGPGQPEKVLHDVLQAVPSAALEELTLKRESADLPLLEGRVRFVLFLGAQ
jgi:hypothetical protein